MELKNSQDRQEPPQGLRRREPGQEPLYLRGVHRPEGGPGTHRRDLRGDGRWNEKEHAKLFFKHLASLAPGALEITATYPVVTGDTAAQLKAAFEGENEEWTALYPEFARIAREEGFPEIASAFDWVSKVEKEHEDRFPPPARPRGQRHRLPAGREDLLALPELRPHPRGGPWPPRPAPSASTPRPISNPSAKPSRGDRPGVVTSVRWSGAGNHAIMGCKVPPVADPDP